MKRKRLKRRVWHDRKTFPYKLLAICVILIIILLLIWDMLKISEKEEEKELWGELRILKWGFPWNTVILEMVNYSINNETIGINVNWSNGSGYLHAILFQFERGDLDCNHSLTTNLPQVLGENKTYEIKIQDTVCQGVDFNDVLGVIVTPGVDIIINQIQDFSNLSLNKNEDAIDILELYNYFNCSVDYLMFFWASAEENITTILNISIRETLEGVNRSALVSFYPDYNWVGEERVNITASCADEFMGDSFYIRISENVTNTPPTFLAVECGDLTWEVNKSYVLDMKTCWEDENNDSLDFRYEDFSEKNLSILRSGDNLSLTSATNWNGTGYFYIYANDLKNETQGRVDFKVFKIVNITTTNQTNVTNNQTNMTTGIPNIKSYSPSNEEVNISSNGSIEFFIDVENYDSIKWYLDGVLVKSEVNSYTAEKLSEGTHEIKVEVKKGVNVVSKSWSLYVSEKETPKKKFSVYFFVFFVVVGILILVVILFLLKNLKQRKEEKRETPVIKEIQPGIRVGFIPPSKP